MGNMDSIRMFSSKPDQELTRLFPRLKNLWGFFDVVVQRTSISLYRTFRSLHISTDLVDTSSKAWDDSLLTFPMTDWYWPLVWALKASQTTAGFAVTWLCSQKSVISEVIRGVTLSSGTQNWDRPHSQGLNVLSVLSFRSTWAWSEIPHGRMKTSRACDKRGLLT